MLGFKGGGGLFLITTDPSSLVNTDPASVHYWLAIPQHQLTRLANSSSTSTRRLERAVLPITTLILYCTEGLTVLTVQKVSHLDALKHTITWATPCKSKHFLDKMKLISINFRRCTVQIIDCWLLWVYLTCWLPKNCFTTTSSLRIMAIFMYPGISSHNKIFPWPFGRFAPPMTGVM